MQGIVLPSEDHPLVAPDPNQLQPLEAHPPASPTPTLAPDYIILENTTELIDTSDDRARTEKIERDEDLTPTTTSHTKSKTDVDRPPGEPSTRSLSRHLSLMNLSEPPLIRAHALEGANVKSLSRQLSLVSLASGEKFEAHR